MREPVVLLKLGECPASLVHCSAARCRPRLRLCIFRGRPGAPPDPLFVVLWIEAAEGRDFLEGARTLEGSSVRFRIYLENFVRTFTP